MNKLFMILGAVALISATSFLFMSQGNLNSYGNNEYTVGLWNNFQKTYNRLYSSDQEEIYRFSVFLENLAYIEQNQGQTYTLGITKFADLTKEEFASNYLTLTPRKSNKNKVFKSTTLDFPTSVNWVESGNVPAVKDQGYCGSCWAFSAAGTISIAYNVQNGGNQVNLSEQQLVSCDNENFGCNGGWMDTAFEYNRKTGLATDAQYPYASYQGEVPACNEQIANQEDNLRNTGTVDVREDSEQLEEAISITAVAVAVDASNWGLYQGGIFDACSRNLNHGVIAVGYQNDEQNSYWLVRNSWGANWGEDGYIRLAWGDTCGILTAASYVTVV